ncbi:helix-turn-helix domain-containing protein [Microbacterium hominis]|uniref:Helix-turn-helix domain-containing protein n=2 Tax=Microbacterium hominis TaxID=162426 RepID=A0A7D4UHT3_9MICO|nr:helix-turn-helix domain-containing protein [Microbacterium hominis]
MPSLSARARPEPGAATIDLSAFRAAVDDSFVPLHVSSAGHESFRGALRAASFDGIHLTEVTASAHAVERTSDLIARDDRAFFKVSLMLAGRALLVQDRRETVLSPGDLAVYDTSRPYSLVFDESMRTIVLMLPREALGVPSTTMQQLTAVRFSGDEGMGAMIAPFLSQLSGAVDGLPEATGARLSHAAVDLVTTLFLHELGTAASTADPHDALRRRIHEYIDAHLSEADLSPGTIARAHFISTRHLHGLFQSEGTTVSTWIRQRRLEQCRRDLLDPAWGHQPVSSVGARWGFPDAAHFSRTFKSAYGVSPSAYRAGR